MNKDAIMMAQQNGGQEILSSLERLNDHELKALLIEMFRNTIGNLDTRYEELLTGKESSVTRTVKNQRTVKIEISHWDTMIIDWAGISMKGEHGPADKVLYFPAFVALHNHLRKEYEDQEY